MTLIRVQGLCVSTRNAAGVEADIVHDVGFSLTQGEVLALIGESGSGKTTTALALLGYARPGCHFRAGRVMVGETDVLRMSPSAMPDFRGRRVAYVAQSAAASFNPAQRLLDQVVEGVVVRRQLGRAAAEAKAMALFADLGLLEPGRIGQRYPHQVSGGQLQRVMAAMALITDPELVVLDEPTTALDVTTQVEVLHAFRRVVRERGATAVYVSHDLAVVAQMADRIVVLKDGRVQENGATGQILHAPAHAYTRSLLHAVPSAIPRLTTSAPSSTAAVLEVDGLQATYGGKGGLPVLQEIGFKLRPGAVLGVIGESGSGKSTLARVLIGLLPASDGIMLLNGRELPTRAAQRTPDQLRQVQIVFQMADAALNPAHMVGRILSRPLVYYHRMDRAACKRRVAELLEMVHLPADMASRYPADLSGGQKQRVNLARALAAEPSVLICDEVTSALDTVVGAAILELLAELRRRLGVAMVFISHDLATVRSIADDILVMYAGRAVELGSAAAFAAAPLHPYSALLARSVPELRQGWLDGLPPRRVLGPAMGAWQANAQSCAFFNRCDVRIEAVCDTQPTPMQILSKGSAIRCCRSEAELLDLNEQGTGFVPAVLQPAP